jgi:phospholipid/cholesterol/gamma-HCH transport system permease protein
MLDYVGKSLLFFFNETGLILRLFSKTLLSILGGQLHWRNFKQQVVHLGYDSVSILCITAFFIGMVFAMQITKEFLKYGAGNVVGGVMAIAIWRELAPVLSAVIVCGRVGAAITAEIGSMQVTEQVEAIKSFGVDEINYLVSPRVWAIAFILPILVIFFDIIALLGSYFMACKVMGINDQIFYNAVQQMPKLIDLSGGLIKAGVFGATIGLIACHKGLNTQGGALGVGISTTKAVVISLLTVFILNYFLSLIIY